jgi:hypothetical protein
LVFEVELASLRPFLVCLTIAVVVLAVVADLGLTGIYGGLSVIAIP